MPGPNTHRPSMRWTRSLPAQAPAIALVIALVFTSGATPAQTAQTAQTAKPADPPPTRADVPAPPPMLSGPNDERIEPIVTIRKEQDREIEEYRIRGQLFAMRVKVKGAPPYWLIDPDGSGRMVPGQNIGPSIAVPKWVLREF